MTNERTNLSAKDDGKFFFWRIWGNDSYDKGVCFLKILNLAIVLSPAFNPTT